MTGLFLALFGLTNVVSDFDPPIEAPVLSLVVVPEPSVPMLGAVATLAMLLRRRRSFYTPPSKTKGEACLSRL